MARRQDTVGVGRFIRARKAEILEAWKKRARPVGRAHRIAESQLVDHMPFLIDCIAQLTDEYTRAERDPRGAGESPHLPRACEPPHAPSSLHPAEPREHARQRVALGFDVADLVAEYALLRESILELWEGGHGEAPPKASTRPFHLALDQAVSESVDHYIALRDRTFEALDGVSAAAFASADVDDLIRRLFLAFIAAMPDVQTCVLMLREGERLRVRTSVGIEEELTRENFSVAVGEGFAGTIAATCAPLGVRSAASDDLVTNPLLRSKQVKALYGLPLVHPSKGVIGVAHMGSQSVEEFSREDKDLFARMVDRAALAIEYQTARQEARDALRARDEVLSVVSHDLRNPLGNVTTAVELLRRTLPEDPSGRSHRSIETIDRATRRMTRLIEDLLDYGSIEAGQLGLHLRLERPGDIVVDTVEAHASHAAQHGMRLASRVEGSLPSVVCDRERILQVLVNFVSNATKFSPSGTAITVSARAEGASEVRFEVADEGPGIDDDDLPHVFERYWRAPQSTVKGRGLGLSIAKGIIEAHHGTIGVESAKGRGATFWFRLPVGGEPGV